MKRIILSLLLAGFCSFCYGAQDAGWLRKNSISPDGKAIAFSYQGDIFTVGIEGGLAKQITTNVAYDSDPLWSPDGKKIIFSSFREGSKDIWTVDANGGTPQRLTSLQGNETPICITPDGFILFKADIQIDPTYIGWFNDYQTYKVSVDGGKIEMFLPFQIEAACFNAQGDMIYENYKGVEDNLRKHHTSSVAHDIFIRKSNGEFQKLSSYAGNNLNPVFAADGKCFFFLCEQGGNLNIWKSSIDKPEQQSQFTSFATHPVRYISIANNGTISCSFNGDLWVLEKGCEPRKLNISIVKDNHEKLHTYMVASSASSLAPSPNGKEVAVISRGDVYITSEEYRTTKRITATPEQERNVCFDNEGRAVYYSSERNGEWGIYRTTLKNKKDKYFTYSYEFKEERVTEPGQTCFQPKVSPDGEWLAFLRDRSTIVIKNLKTGKEKVLLEGVNYSYSDGDQELEWCPDSHHIACTYMVDGGWNNTDIAVIDIDNGEIHNITRSGYSDGSFRWTHDGKAITYESDKQGYRSHGSWGAEQDIYIAFLDPQAYKQFRMEEEIEKLDKLLAEGDKKAEKKAEKDSIKQTKIEKLTFDYKNLEDRIVRLTPAAGTIGDHYLSPDYKKLFFVSKSTDGTGMYCIDTKKKDLKLVKKGLYANFVPSVDGESIFMRAILGISKMNVKTQSSSSVYFTGDYEYDAAAERDYIFEHCWKQVNDKFYDASIHNIDWKGFHDNYKQFLPYINNNHDFRELLSEMLGELNGSHTGGRYSVSLKATTGHLGVLFDTDYTGEGLRILEVLPSSILAFEYPDLSEGDLIVAIDGVKIQKGQTWYEALDRKVSKRVMLTIKKGNKESTVYVTPTGTDSAPLYKRWVRRNEEIVEKLSGGRVGYVHVQGMNSQSFREVFANALGKYRHCEALIVDSRNNGGGWLTDDLISFLSGKRYVDYTPRGQYIGSGPYDKWTKPSCVLMGENNYSDACGFPFAYKANKLGKLIGAPVPGTMTAVWWETQVDPSLVFGIPQVTSRSVETGEPIENNQVEPDILIYNDPASLIAGRDLQLEAAVSEMLKEIDK